MGFDEERHTPVMLDEVLSALTVSTNAVCADLTFGRGGHSRAILSRLGPEGRLIVVDRDPEAIAEAKSLAATDSRVRVADAPFSRIKEIIAGIEGVDHLDAALLDLGVSSPQLDDAHRGFSFRADGPLDMRMDPRSGRSAAEWLATASAEDIAHVLWTFGEERYSRRIARAIVTARQQQAITTTMQLSDVVRKAIPRWEKTKDPATRSFQAIRIFINRELEEIETALSDLISLLAPGGRLAVISFHSLEDRIVKRFFRRLVHGEALPPGLPVSVAEWNPVVRNLGRAQRASEAECSKNPRARSAVLRVVERLP
ncbi:MAG: 16S rRNA (cytosine(1402)-N(4))-methyltransferase RsmH [Gammaproteobacteria bacterium]|nr:16S rRNA (cytosine(1402)-N(4))-methyltransferase RsmH [Gammaproteobacteria bacterium]